MPSLHAASNAKPFDKSLILGIQTKEYDPNELDEKNNTLMHLIARSSFIQERELCVALMAAGLNPRLRNEYGQDIVDIFLQTRPSFTNYDPNIPRFNDAVNSYYQDLYFLYDLLQKYYPDANLLNKILEAYSNLPNNEKFLSLIDVHQLPLISLNGILSWFDKEHQSACKMIKNLRSNSDSFYRGWDNTSEVTRLSDYKNSLLLKQKETEDQIKFLKKYGELPNTLMEIVLSKKTKIIFFKAMLLDEDICSLLSEISNDEEVLNGLSQTEYDDLAKFLKQFEQRRQILEELSVQPPALTPDELKVRNRFVQKLRSAYPIKHFPMARKLWDENYEMQSGEPLAKTKYTKLISGLKEIFTSNPDSFFDNNGSFLFFGENGALAQHQKRQKCLQATEKRLSQQTSPKLG